jgi:hypothetical protein
MLPFLRWPHNHAKLVSVSLLNDMVALSIRSAMFSVGRLGIVGCGMNRRFGTRVREVDLFVGSSKGGLVSSMLDSMSVSCARLRPQAEKATLFVRHRLDFLVIG